MIAVSHSGTSSPSASSHLETEEQEQMVVARALAKLHQSEESSPSSPNDRQRSRQRPASWRNPHPTSNLRFYPMPPQNWLYPNFAPEATMYQMWHQAPPLHARDPTFIPVQQSVYQPSQVSFLPSVDQTQLSSPYLPVYFSDYSASVPFGGRYPAVLGKTHENDGHGERGNSHPSQAVDSSLPFCSTDASITQKPLQDEEQKCASCGFNSDESVSCPFAAQGSDDLREPQDMKADRRSQRKTFSLLPRDWSPSAPSHSFVCDQDLNSLIPALHGVHPVSSSSSYEGREFRTPSSLHPSGPKGSALRPQISSTIQTAIPVCSSRSSPCFAAPPVTVRSAIPVFSAPPATMKPEANQRPNHEKEIVSDVGAKFVKFRIWANSSSLIREAAYRTCQIWFSRLNSCFGNDDLLVDMERVLYSAKPLQQRLTLICHQNRESWASAAAGAGATSRRTPRRTAADCFLLGTSRWHPQVDKSRGQEWDAMIGLGTWTHGARRRRDRRSFPSAESDGIWPKTRSLFFFF